MWSCGSEWIISSAARCFSASTIRAEEAAGASERFHLTGFKPEDIDVVMTVDEVDVQRQQQALDCYVTYQQTIEEAGARRNISRCVHSRFHSCTSSSGVTWNGETWNRARLSRKACRVTPAISAALP
jgi:hypothetical protein